VRDAALDGEVSRTLEGAAAQLQAGKWPQARGPIEQADQLLAAAGRAGRPQRLQELQRDLTMAERLEGIYSRFVDNNWAYAQNRAYAEAFRDYGLDLTVLSAAQAAERIRGRTIRLELVLALDFWSLCSIGTGPQTKPDGRHLRAIARAADPDPWRHRLRDALDDAKWALRNRPQLLALAAAADALQQPPESLALLGRAFGAERWGGLGIRPGIVGRVGPPPKSDKRSDPKPKGAPKLDEPRPVMPVEVLLRNGQRLHPDNVWLNIALGEYCLYEVRRYDEALRCFTAARTLRPHSPFITHSLGLAHYYRGSVDEACAEFSRAIELNPDYLEAWLARGTASFKRGKWDVVVADFSKVLERLPDKTRRDPLIVKMLTDWNPSWVTVRFYRGSAYTQLGQWDLAIADFAAALDVAADHGPARQARAYANSILGRWREAAADLTPADFANAPLNDVWFQVACLQLLQGGDDAYRRLCRQLLERIGQTEDGFTGYQAFLASRICMLRPATDPDPKQCLAWAEEAAAAQPKVPGFVHTAAVAHYRAGHFEQALARSQESMKADPKWGGKILNWLVLALAHERLGQAGEARKWMDKASSWRDKAALGPGKGEGVCPPDLPLSDWLEFQVLYPEAEAIFNGPKWRP
jgi:tetratricopeptide (TPR) repeat protein